MTTEQIRLEIQVQVKEALKDLAATSEEIKKLGKEAKAVVPAADELKATMGKLQSELRNSDQVAKLLDDQLGGLRNRTNLLKQAMTELVARGIDPASSEMQGLKREFEAASVATREMEEKSRLASGSLGDLGKALSSIGAVTTFAMVGREVVDLGKNAIDTAGRYEMLQANFETLTGSATAAAEVFGELKQFANVTPFNLEGVAQAGQQLMAAKVPMQDLQTRLGQLGDLSLGNSQKFESMTAAFSKMSTKGKVDMEQLNIFLEAGVPVLDELAKGLGTTTEAVFDMMQKGQVSTADFVAAMERMTSSGGQFFGGMKRGSETWQGVWSTAQDSIEAVSASFGNLLLPAAKTVAKAITDVSSAIADSPILKGILAGALVTVTGLLIALGVAVAANTAKTWLAYAAEMALNAVRAVANPLLLAAIAAVGIATAGYIAYASSQNKAAEATKNSGDAAKDAASNYRDVGAAMAVAKTVANDYGKALDDLRKKQNDAAASWKDKFKQDLPKELAMESLRAQTAGSTNPYASLGVDLGGTFLDASSQSVGVAGSNIPGLEKVVQLFMDKNDAGAQQALKEIAGQNIEAYRQILDLFVAKRDTLDAAQNRKAADEAAALQQAADDAMAASDAWDAMYAQIHAGDAADEAAALQQAADDAMAASDAWDAMYAQIHAGDAAEEAAALQQAADDAMAASEAWDEMYQRIHEENLADYAARSAQEMAKNTEVGKMLGWGGQPAQDWKQVLIDSALNMAMENESVKKVLNIFSTLLKGIVEVVLPPLAKALQWLYDGVIVPVGNGFIRAMNGVIDALNKIPGVSIKKLAELQTSAEIADQQARIAAKLQAVNDAMDAIRQTFTDKRQELEDAYSQSVDVYRKLLEHGTISAAQYSTTIAELNDKKKNGLADLAAQEKSQLSVLEDISNRLRDGIAVSDTELKTAGVDVTNSYLKAQLEAAKIPVPEPAAPGLPPLTDLPSDPVQAAGAVVGNVANFAVDVGLGASTGAMIGTMIAPGIGTVIGGGAGALIGAGTSLLKKIGWLDVGSVELPADQISMVHKGEMIVPRSFADGLRSGEVTLGKGGSGKVVNVTTTVHVSGSAVAMDGLAADLAPRIARQVRRGLVEVDG